METNVCSCVYTNICIIISEWQTVHLHGLLHMEPSSWGWDLTIADHTFESVDQIKYLELLLSRMGDTTITIQERVQAASRAYFAHVKLLKSKHSSRRTRTLKPDTITQLIILDRIVSGISGPLREENCLYNNELEELIQGEKVVRFVKSQCIRWLGYVCRKPDERLGWVDLAG